MPLETSKPASDTGLNLVLFNLPQFLLLQVGTASILLLLLASKTTVETLQMIGEVSEELFRGERLPIINFPEPNEINRS